MKCALAECLSEAANGSVLCLGHGQMAQAAAERKRELEELGPLIDRRCRVVLDLTASTRGMMGKGAALSQELERQEHELLRLLWREQKLQGGSPASGKAAADRAAESSDR